QRIPFTLRHILCPKIINLLRQRRRLLRPYQLTRVLEVILLIIRPILASSSCAPPPLLRLRVFALILSWWWWWRLVLIQRRRRRRVIPRLRARATIRRAPSTARVLVDRRTHRPLARKTLVAHRLRHRVL